MISIFGLLALLVVDTGAGASADIQIQSAAEAGRPAPGYVADVEAIANGVSRHGRLIVTGDGVVHLEHLDDETARWASAAIHRASRPARGWDTRTEPVRCVWRPLGPSTALAEVHTSAGSLTITRHQLLPTR